FSRQQCHSPSILLSLLAGFMGESFKTTCALILIVSSVGAAFAWFDDDRQRPSQMVWAVRIVAPAVAVLALAVLLKVQFRRDKAPDYLRALVGNGYFNRD